MKAIFEESMQTKKENVRATILEAAKAEFLALGFEKASLRQIASHAGVTKGNVYTYFKNKDELFRSIVEPAMEYMSANLSGGGDSYSRTYDHEPEFSEQKLIENFRGYVQDLFQLQDELRLLYYSSVGSSLEGFREEIFEMYGRGFQKFSDNRAASHSKGSSDVSEMMIHSLAAMYLSFIEEVLVHAPDKVELDKYITQIGKFMHAGVRQLMAGD